MGLVTFFMSAMDLMRYCRGFRAKSATVDDFEWSYIDRPAKKADRDAKPEIVVFLHGFGSMKEAWLRVASGLDKQHEIVIPDLPGHGRSLPLDPQRSYAMEVQAHRLHRFLEATIPADRDIHVVGCSLGGMLAGLYAAMYPQRVRSVTMLCPAGISMPHQSDASRLLDETGKNLLLANTAEDLSTVNDMMNYKAAKVPHWIMAKLADERAKQMPVLEKIVADSIVTPTLLEEHLHEIRAKTLVMWGKNDRILDHSSLAIMREKMQHAVSKHFIVVDECGHLVQHEKYKDCIQAINAFLQDRDPTVGAKEKRFAWSKPKLASNISD